MILVPLMWMVLAAGPVKLAAPGLTYVGLDEKRGDAYVEFFADQLRAQGLDVTTKSQISAVLGFESQRQLLGCGDSSQACLAELAGALGVDGLITGSLNRSPRGAFVVTLTVVGAQDGRTVASASHRAGDEDGLYDFLDRFSRESGKRITSALRAGAQQRASPTPVQDTPAVKKPPAPTRVAEPAPPAALQPPPDPGASPGPSFHPGWLVAGAGAVSAIAGGVVFALAAQRHGEILEGDAEIRDRTGLVTEVGKVQGQQTLSAILVGAGVVIGGGGATWALLAQPRLALSSRSATVSFSWVLP